MATVASLRDVPGRVSKEMVAEGKPDRWFTVSGPTVCSMLAIVLRGMGLKLVSLLFDQT